MSAPLGNKNASKTRVWSAAIERALERRQNIKERYTALEELADKLIDQCYDGDLAALQELGNRLEGKPAQSLTIGGDDENPLQHNHTVRFIDGGSGPSSKA